MRWQDRTAQLVEKLGEAVPEIVRVAAKRAAADALDDRPARALYLALAPFAATKGVIDLKPEKVGIYFYFISKQYFPRINPFADLSDMFAL